MAVSFLVLLAFMWLQDVTMKLRCCNGISDFLFMFVMLQGKVVVIRGEGPKGGPGMPEMLTPTSAIMGAGLGKV